MMIMKAGFYIIQNGQLFKEPDVLEGPGDSLFVDFNGFMPGDILAVQFDKSLIRLI